MVAVETPSGFSHRGAIAQSPRIYAGVFCLWFSLYCEGLGGGYWLRGN